MNWKSSHLFKGHSNKGHNSEYDFVFQSTQVKYLVAEQVKRGQFLSKCKSPLSIQIKSLIRKLGNQDGEFGVAIGWLKLEFKTEWGSRYWTNGTNDQPAKALNMVKFWIEQTVNIKRQNKYVAPLMMLLVIIDEIRYAKAIQRQFEGASFMMLTLKIEIKLKSF